MLNLFVTSRSTVRVNSSYESRHPGLKEFAVFHKHFFLGLNAIIVLWLSYTTMFYYQKPLVVLSVSFVPMFLWICVNFLPAGGSHLSPILVMTLETHKPNDVPVNLITDLRR